MTSSIMQSLDLLLLTFAALAVGFKLGQRGKFVRPLPKIGHRVTWLKKTSKGNYKPMKFFVRTIIGDMIRLDALDFSEFKWVNRARLIRR